MVHVVLHLKSHHLLMLVLIIHGETLMIVSDDNDSNGNIVINKEVPIEKFQPLSDINRRRIVMKFNFFISSYDIVEYTGEGNACKKPPIITKWAIGNSACLFNSFSLLLSGKELYNTFIRHAVCNYICEPRNWDKIKHFIPDYKCGKDYVDLNTVSMHRNVTCVLYTNKQYSCGYCWHVVKPFIAVLGDYKKCK